ncbi:MAG: SOS response-associated peptidase [Planctomycetes bacterium]|nr:SOS response-associated peptidase [Planctomycetota bacterium]
MCGRFALSEIPRSLLQSFGLSVPVITPRYNIAPKQMVPVVMVDGGGQPTVQELRWGLLPYWS